MASAAASTSICRGFATWQLFEKLRQVRRAKQFGAMTEEVPEAAVPETAVPEAAAVAVPEESAAVQSAAVPTESAEVASPAPVQSAAPGEGASLDALGACCARC